MRQKIKIDKQLAIIMSIYLLCLIDTFVFVPFQIKNFFSIQSKMQELEKNIEQFRNERSCKEKFISDKERIRKDIFNLENKIITFEDISALQAYISGKAKNNGLEIASITLSPPQNHKTTSKGQFLYAPLKITLESNFHSLGSFFNDFERGDYFLMVKEILIRGGRPYHTVVIDLGAIIKK
ncbi:MAG: type 4a pilus biogenesis protein PilO [Candidatus Omnitrophica bacterium]|nr:type 4a pilus biogenesis protein PilO [Candidatus Omnitrophota bacterium]